MCRAAKFCTELGQDPSSWSRFCPLPPPEFFDASLDQFLLAFPKPKKYTGILETQKTITPFESEVYRRDGYRCRYCLIRVIDTKALMQMEKIVGAPHFKVKGKGNQIRHGIALAFRATADHVVPISFGGRTNLDNLVTSCWNCNYGKYNALLEQMKIDNPCDRPTINENLWDGLTSTL